MYEKTTWTPRTATNKFLKANETTESVELTNDPEGVTVSGTPFTADNMNNIEDGIQSAHYTEFTQPSTLSNISSGEELTSRWGKVKKAINLIIGWLNQGVKTTDNPTFDKGIKTLSGFAGGLDALAIDGGAVGRNANATYGGAVGLNAIAGSGGVVGYNATATTGGAVGSIAKATTGGVVGNNATATTGGAVGFNTDATNGFAGGYGASANYNDASAIGTLATATATNQIRLGTFTETVLLGNGATVTSDKRDKIDIEDNDLGLEFLQKVVTKKFRKNPRELYYIRDDKGKVKKDENNNLVYDEKAHKAGEKKGKRFHRGMIAQELEASVDNMNFSAVKHFSYSDDKNNDEYAIDYGQFIPICIKAIQEQQEQIEKLTEALGK